jgi:hypothetical protein
MAGSNHNSRIDLAFDLLRISRLPSLHGDGPPSGGMSHADATTVRTAFVDEWAARAEHGDRGLGRPDGGSGAIGSDGDHPEHSRGRLAGWGPGSG